jgi:hypothetical protein
MVRERRGEAHRERFNGEVSSGSSVDSEVAVVVPGDDEVLDGA